MDVFKRKTKNPMMKMMGCFGWLLAATTLAQASELEIKEQAWRASDWKCYQSLSYSPESKTKELADPYLETYVKPDGYGWFVAKFWAD